MQKSGIRERYDHEDNTNELVFVKGQYRLSPIRECLVIIDNVCTLKPTCSLQYLFQFLELSERAVLMIIELIYAVFTVGFLFCVQCSRAWPAPFYEEKPSLEPVQDAFLIKR